MSSFFQPMALLDFLSIHRHTGFTESLASVLYFQLLAIAILLIYLAYRRLERMITRRGNEAREREIIEALRQNDTRVLSSLAKRRRPFGGLLGPRGPRYFLRRIIIRGTRVGSSELVVRFQDFYRIYGYRSEDEALAQSRFWWVRLAALIRLERMQLPECEWIFDKLSRDPRELISLAALRALGKLAHHQGFSRVMDRLARFAPARRDLILEILESHGRKFPAELMRFIDECYDPYMASLCIQVVGRLGMRDQIERLQTLLKSSDDEVVAESVRSLSLLLDAKEQAMLIPYLHHESRLVQRSTFQVLSESANEDVKKTVRSIVQTHLPKPSTLRGSLS